MDDGDDDDDAPVDEAAGGVSRRSVISETGGGVAGSGLPRPGLPHFTCFFENVREQQVQLLHKG